MLDKRRNSLYVTVPAESRFCFYVLRGKVRGKKKTERERERERENED